MRSVAPQPVLVAVETIIKYLMHNGSANPEELFNNAKTKKRTYYRALKCLLEANVVIKREDGFYCWYEYLENVSFNNELEAKEWLNHSQNITKGLRLLTENEKRRFKDNNSLVNKDYYEHAIMHIKTGYPEIYKNYFQSEKDRKERLKLELNAKEKIKSGILASFQVLFPEHLTFIILEDIKAILTGRVPAFFENLKIINEEVRSIGYTLAKKGSFDDLQKFISKQEEESENRDSCGKIIDLSARYYHLRQAFEKEINLLIRMVENGTPISGRCHLCPKIKIRHKN